MKRSAILPSLLLGCLSLSAVPAAAHGVFVPVPRDVSGGVLESKVLVLATNQGLQPRRFRVIRVTPEPFGPPSRHLLHEGFVPSRETAEFELPVGEFSSLLEVEGAPQIVIAARLEVFEGGSRIETAALPSLAGGAGGHQDARGEGRVSLPHEQQFDHFQHLQGLEASPDGQATTDFGLANFDPEGEAECAFEVSGGAAQGVFGVPFLHAPAGAAALFDGLFTAYGPDEGLVEEVHNAWLVVACEHESYAAWAIVHRDGGRDVTVVLPSASVR